MPLPSRTQLVLAEIAAGAALTAFALRGVWSYVGGTVAAVALLLAVVPVGRRGLYGVVGSWFGMRSRRPSRRRAAEGPGAWSVTVPSAGRGPEVGAIRDVTTWSVPLALPLTDLFNDDVPIDLDRVATLLTVEDVPLASVRLVTVTAPVRLAASAPAGPVEPVARSAARYLVLSLDTSAAADVIAERGGSAAIHQILRRCVLRAEEVLTANGVKVVRLPETAVALESARCLNPGAATVDGGLGLARETLGDVRFPDGLAVTYSLEGDGVLDRLDRVAQSLPVPLVATSVVLEHGPRREAPRCTVLLRLTGPPDVVRRGEEQLTAMTRALGVRADRVVGEQLPLLRATTLLGTTGRGAA